MAIFVLRPHLWLLWFWLGGVKARLINGSILSWCWPTIKKESLKQKLRDCAFTGADAAPRMVMLARVNMALQGAPKAQIFYTDNSLTTNALKPNSFDLFAPTRRSVRLNLIKAKWSKLKSQLRSQYGASARWFSPDQKSLIATTHGYDHVK